MSEQFPNAPLVLAVLEARFAGEVAAEAARAAIQKEIRGELPKLYVPNATLGQAMALLPYVFRSADESESFEVAINKVSYVTRSYAGFPAFRERALHFMDVFRRHVPEVQKLTRVGLRYVNHLAFLRESPAAPIQVDDYLNVQLELPASVPFANLTTINTVFAVRVEGGALNVTVKNEPPQDPFSPEVLVLAGC